MTIAPNASSLLLSTPDGKTGEVLIDATQPDLVEEFILANFAHHGQPVVVIDGRSGSGKTTLANTLFRRHHDWQLVHADDLYPGWSGLSQVWDLSDLVTGHRYRRWDWYENRFADEVTLDHNRPLVIEGCGVLTPVNARLACVRVWCEAPASLRRRRALARDPEFRDYWAMWAIQEGLHIARHKPADLADLTVSNR
ncbi:hypothetical protein [Cutibacterium sp.]|uniref:hypothetical protein n=1 Tax=Cutibacterium sp. TaxID=1912221 RepID=UPI0026DC8165|nr:hypothetical protein [Cutibacterium sp.]MDO4412783.1 hypothetical protein [Cutibacterium sp.]